VTHRLLVSILPQPTGSTCGPTCLHAVYAYHGDRMELPDLVAAIPEIETGGTLGVHLAHHALRRGYRARIYTYNLRVFDPTWFALSPAGLRERLALQLQARTKPRIREATQAYLEYLDLGGEVRLEDPTPELVGRYLDRGFPLLAGLSATYLYRAMREHGPAGERDDVRGLPVGHFVVLCGHDSERGSVLVADPLLPNPFSPEHVYEIGMERVIAAILLGIVTYDANILVLEPGADRPRGSAP
jgi:hypothetical protein